MTIPFFLRGFLFGLGFAVYTLASSIYVMEAPPSSEWAWIKLGAQAVLALVIGWYTFSRDPEATWGSLPRPGVKPIP